MVKKIFYPVTEVSLHEYAESIFTPIERGESVATIWIPMSGRRKHNKFITENIELFEKELPEFENYILVYVESLELTEESISGYLRLMAKSFIGACKKNAKCQKLLEGSKISIFDDPESTYSNLLEGLRNLLKDVIAAGFNIVFFVGDFDELSFANKIFYNNLMSLWNDLNPNFHYVFLLRETLARQQNLQLWGELSEAILQNIVFVPALNEEDTDYMIEHLKNEYSLKLSSHQLNTIREICGGHPYLLRVAFRILANHFDKHLTRDQIRDLFYDNYELRWAGQKIFEIRNSEEKILLKKIALREQFDKKANKEVYEFLTNMGLVKVINKELRPFNKLFSRTIQGFEKTELIKKEEEQGDISLDNKTGAITYKGRTVEERFTRQEYSVLAEFLRSPDKLVSRDDVGKILWGKEMYEKYSDWALDQLISKLRKKLKGLDVSGKLLTIRGKGYKFLQNS